MTELPDEAVLLRIHIGEDDRHDGLPLYEAIVRKARSLGLAGATVLRGSMGFGANSLIHTSKVLRISGDLPLVIEIIDRQEEIDAFLPHLQSMMEGGGIVTQERVRVLVSGPSREHR